MSCFSPGYQLVANVLRAVVAADGERFATLQDHLIQGVNDTLCGQRQINVHRKCFAVKVID